MPFEFADVYCLVLRTKMTNVLGSMQYLKLFLHKKAAGLAIT